MVALFISILKTIILLKKLTSEWLKVGDNKVNKFGIDSDEEIARKLKNLKGEKLFKSQKLAKLRKKLSKSENLSNFGIIKAGSKFITLNIKTAFNHL